MDIILNQSRLLTFARHTNMLIYIQANTLIKNSNLLTLTQCVWQIFQRNMFTLERNLLIEWAKESATESWMEMNDYLRLSL